MQASLGKITDPARGHPLVPGVRMPIGLLNPLQPQFRAFCEANRRLAGAVPAMLQPNVRTDKVLALCGAGPALRGAVVANADDVWACNSALPYLLDRGVRVTAAVGIDQTDGLRREWQSAPDVPYYVATTCNPTLITHLLDAGRSLSWFHNGVGFAPPEEELQFYRDHWPRPACVMAHGATVVPRAIGLALWMGYERIDVYGADCAFGPGDIAHANGEHADAAYGRPDVSSGIVNGRVWRTRPDMLMAAVDLARLVKQSAGRVRLIGDTLAVALQSKADDYLDLVMRRVEPGEVIAPTTVTYTEPH